ncbi:15417_t:CDS:2 [Funneliformis geosporum]|uniref:15417_t:CDS:1 n=1 Tax=Funneliformis geosporum TaxID=1117311 RepID=A0A9W4SXH9_9GLOM|nr:15417_t:CDS:2 [Funneliformis geosporum]
MSNKNFSKRPYYEINSDLEKNTLNEELNLDKESSELLEKSNSILSLLDENDKKNKSAVWDHFDKFVDNKVANDPAQDQNKSNFFGLFEIGNDSSDEDELEEYLR